MNLTLTNIYLYFSKTLVYNINKVEVAREQAGLGGSARRLHQLSFVWKNIL